MKCIPVRTDSQSWYRSVALVAGFAIAATAAGWVAPTAAQAVIGPTVSSWITTPDRSRLMASGPSQIFDSAGTRPGQMITLNPSQKFQTMDGFGASITDSSAKLLYQLPATQRAQVMSSIFDPAAGIGMSFLRQPIGGSDMISGAPYTYDDLPAGQTDLTMARFSIAHDEAQILPLLRQALALNPTLKVIGSPWSPPAWMKDNGSLVGGRLKTDAATVRAYALYLTRFIQAYQAAGVPIYGITVQNEPQNRTPSGYAGTDMPVSAQAAVINALGPMLRDAGLANVKIISYDHNWAEHPDDIADAASLGVDPEPNYASDILNSSAAQWIAGTAYHCYYGDPSVQTALHNAFPAKDIWFTECSGWHAAADAPSKYFADTLQWHAKNIEVGTIQNWAKSVVNWSLALDSAGNPHSGGCGDATGWCTGVVAIDGTTVTRNAEYYALGHLSKFVKTGAVRIGSNDTGDLRNVAFTNPDGSTAVYVTNTGGSAQTFGITWNGMVVTQTIPAGAVGTFTWPPGGSGADTTAPSAPSALAASGTTATSTNLSWTASTDNVGVTEYIIYRGGVQVGTSAISNFAVTGLSASTAYVFTVRARDAAGNLSAASNTADVTTTAGGGNGPIDSTKWYQVINTNSAKCLDAANRSTTNGTVLQQWACSSPAATNQLWQFRPTGTGTYQVVNRNAGTLVWDVNGGPAATGDGVQVHLWTYVGGTNQQWRPVARADASHGFTALNSGKCLDVRDVSTSDGAWLQQWTCTGGPAQSFRLVMQP